MADVRVIQSFSCRMSYNARMACLSWDIKHDYGVAEHWVTVATGQTILNPIRVAPNGSGCEVVFTAFQQPGMSDESFVTKEKHAIGIETPFSVSSKRSG